MKNVMFHWTKTIYFENRFENKRQYMSRAVKPLACGQFPIYQKWLSKEVLYNNPSFSISPICVVNTDFLKSSLQIGWKYKNKTLPYWQPLSFWKTLFIFDGYLYFCKLYQIKFYEWVYIMQKYPLNQGFQLFWF